MSVSALTDAEQSCSVSHFVIKNSLVKTVTVLAFYLDNHVLPPWPAEVPVVCVGMEEKVGACWWPRHYGSSAPTGNQTKAGKNKKSMHVLSDSAQHVSYIFKSLFHSKTAVLQKHFMLIYNFVLDP